MSGHVRGNHVAHVFNLAQVAWIRQRERRYSIAQPGEGFEVLTSGNRVPRVQRVAVPQQFHERSPAPDRRNPNRLPATG